MGDEEQLSVIFDAIPTAIAYVDRDERYLRVNAAFRAWFGDVTDKQVGDVLDESTYARVSRYVPRVLAGERVTFRMHVPFPDGTQRWLEAHYVPDRDESGNVRGYTAQLHDVTEQHNARERLALLVDTSTLLAESVDQDDTAQAIAHCVVPALADWSALYLDRFGVMLPKAIAHSTRLTTDATWKLARAFMPQPCARAKVQGEHVVVPLVARGKRLAVLVFAAHSRTDEDLLLADELGRRASAALDVARLFDQQRRANERLQEADRRKDELIAVVGHELRNPLAPIITALDLMDFRGLAGCERERAVIRRQARHMSRLVDDLLDVARVRRGKITLQKQPIELHTIVAKAVELTSPLFEQHEHQLMIDVPRELIVNVDPMRLTQVFANLMTNAAKYTQPRGQIAVTALRRNDRIAVTVSDNGPGIADDLAARIFEPFVQGEHPQQQTDGGLGLGLSLVKSFTELHEGTATVTSSSAGAAFTIELPAFVTVAALAAKSSQPTSARLLLVDDNADAARILAELLREQGFEVAVAFDAPAALVLADEFRPAIALLDIGLPVMDGYELARHLRTRLPTPPRLVAVTGYGDRADPDRSRDAGFDVHLGKPVDFEKLVSVLGSLGPS